MINSKTTTRRKKTATETAVKAQESPILNQKLLAAKPISYSALIWTSTKPSPRERLHLRTRELAFLAGHAPVDITQANYEQAKREVTGESSLSRQNAALDGVV